MGLNHMYMWTPKKWSNLHEKDFFLTSLPTRVMCEDRQPILEWLIACGCAWKVVGRWVTLFIFNYSSNNRYYTRGVPYAGLSSVFCQLPITGHMQWEPEPPAVAEWHVHACVHVCTHVYMYMRACTCACWLLLNDISVHASIPPSSNCTIHVHIHVVCE